MGFLEVRTEDLIGVTFILQEPDKLGLELHLSFGQSLFEALLQVFWLDVAILLVGALRPHQAAIW